MFNPNVYLFICIHVHSINRTKNMTSNNVVEIIILWIHFPFLSVRAAVCRINTWFVRAFASLSYTKNNKINMRLFKLNWCDKLLTNLCLPYCLYNICECDMRCFFFNVNVFSIRHLFRGYNKYLKNVLFRYSTNLSILYIVITTKNEPINCQVMKNLFIFWFLLAKIYAKIKI